MLKKLLFIITKSEMGGAQKFLYELATHLDREKYEITIAAGKSSTGKNELFNLLKEKNNVKTIEIINFSNFFNIRNLLAFIELFNLIRKNQPDIIYLLSSEAGFSGSLAGSLYRLFKRKKIKIIYRIGGWAFKEPRSIFTKKIFLWAEKISAPFKDIIITNSEFDKKLAIKNKIAKIKKIVVVYNGIDFNKLKFLPREKSREILLKLTDHASYTTLIGTIANFYKNKGLEILITAAAKIKISQPSCQFVIIGEGPERQKLQKLIKKLDLGNHIVLAGKIADAYKYLKAFDLFVLPSIKEGQPWAILEAMAAEVPIVATNIAGIPEMIDNEKSGLLVEPNDSNALTTAIEKMLTHTSLAHAMAQNALIAVKERFGMKEMIRKNEELF